MVDSATNETLKTVANETIKAAYTSVIESLNTDMSNNVSPIILEKDILAAQSAEKKEGCTQGGFQ